MNAKSSGLAYFALILSGLALLVSLVVYTTRPRGGPGGTAPPVHRARYRSMVVATFSGQGVFTLVSHYDGRPRGRHRRSGGRKPR
jgi:hypothetical protein